MDCKDCNKPVNLNKKINLSNKTAFACSSCGRLHFENGLPVFTKMIIDIIDNKPVYTKPEKVYLKDKKIIGRC
jgi:hypothetical protein